MPEPDVTSLTIQLSADEIAELRRLAMEANKTASSLVRDWVRERLQEQAKK